MIAVQGYVRLAAGEIERLRPAALAMMAATRAEPGCLEYAFAVDLGEADVLRITERWVDQAALDAHFASPHMGTFNQALAGAKVLGASVKAYEVAGARVLVGAE